MTEGTEHGMECVFFAVLFCLAVSMLLWLHKAAARQLQVIDKEPERAILFEQTEESGWKH